MGKKSKQLAEKMITILLLVISNSLVSAQQPTHLALITELSGTVKVRKAQNYDLETAVWGMQLHAGDEVKTLAASEVSILFSNNNLISLGPESSITIQTGSLSLRENERPVTNVRTVAFADLSNLTLRRTREGEIGALAGLRLGGQHPEIELISPRNSKIKTSRPSFSWQTDEAFEKFKVKLFDSNGSLWTLETLGMQVDFPEEKDALQPGRSYFWQVEGEKLFESIKSQSVGFDVLSKKEMQKIESREQKVLEMFRDNTDGCNYHFILGAYYEKKGLLRDAIDRFEKIAELNPAAPLPHEILGALYGKVGLKDKAISELNRALELSQKR